jgi:hypothetical protein
MVLEDLRRAMRVIAANGGAEFDPPFRLARNFTRSAVVRRG